MLVPTIKKLFNILLMISLCTAEEAEVLTQKVEGVKELIVHSKTGD